jgi:predicted RNase H-like HicB family nuclease
MHDLPKIQANPRKESPMSEGLTAVGFTPSHAVSVNEARQRLEELIDLAIAGEPVYIAVDDENRLQLLPLYR